jgi:tetratricopeptide (TPR) repeat protein
VYQGKYDRGVDALSKSLRIDGVDPDISPDLAYVHALTGRPEEARKTISRLQELAKQASLDPGQFALIYAGLGDREQALAQLEQAFARHSSMMTWLKVDARFDNLRQDPRFQSLMRRVGLL